MALRDTIRKFLEEVDPAMRSVVEAAIDYERANITSDSPHFRKEYDANIIEPEARRRIEARSQTGETL